MDVTTERIGEGQVYRTERGGRHAFLVGDSSVLIVADTAIMPESLAADDRVAVTGMAVRFDIDQVERQLGVDLDYDNLRRFAGFPRPGQRLALTVTNADEDLVHNISLPAQESNRDIPIGGAEVVEVIFPRSGALLFFCTYHASYGMNGELLAGDATPQPPQ